MLSFRDKLFVALLMLLISVSLIVWVSYGYLSVTRAVPKNGGEYIEGIVGQPFYVNPLLSQTSEADSDLAQLVYSGLFTYDKNGELVPDLAETYSVSEDKRVYEVQLKKNVQWHDGKNLTADDVVFTVNALQDPVYKSPLRQSWQGVEVAKKTDYTIVFTLKNPYFAFPDSLTIGILPKHIWENIAPEKFALADVNLHPVGSGPYAFADFQKDANGNILTYKLNAFKAYYGGEAHISKITFNFYPDEEAVVTAYNKKEVMGMGSIAPEKIGELKNIKSTNLHELNIPRYFAVFLNQNKSVALADDNVRKALLLSVDRAAIIKEVLKGKGTALNSPIFPGVNGYKEPGADNDYSIEKAKQILEDGGWKLENGSNVRSKNNVKLSFELITADWPELTQNAELLKQQWEKIGAAVNVKVLAVSDLQQNFIRTREYDALLFGQAVSFQPDLYSFWHSSQKRDPGLNLSMLDSKDADSLLETIRQESDADKRAQEYAKLQDVLYKENSAIFLYGPAYLYPVNTAVQGIEIKNINSPSQRFAGVNKWYIKTKRVWK